MSPNAKPAPLHLWHSLQVRLTLLSLLIFLVSVWSLAWYADLRLHRDMEQMLGQQQLATVTLQAREINFAVTDRMETLEKVTRLLSAELLASPAALQQLLAERPALPSIFNGGFFVTDATGTCISGSAILEGIAEILEGIARRCEVSGRAEIQRRSPVRVIGRDASRVDAFGVGEPNEVVVGADSINHRQAGEAEVAGGISHRPGDDWFAAVPHSVAIEILDQDHGHTLHRQLRGVSATGSSRWPGAVGIGV